MKPPLYQRASKFAMYILGGFLFGGALLDSVANAISLLTPLVASIGTAFIVLLWLLARFLLPWYPLLWVVGDQRVRVRTLGRKPTAFAVGMVILLWIPSVVTQWRPSPPSAEVQPIVEELVKAHKRELAGFHERERAAQDQIKALTEAVTALTQQHGPHIADAVAQLEQGSSAAAERIFQDIFTRKAAEGKAVNQQAAEAARHLGALAFLHDTKKALHAYRQAVLFDPENAEGWTQLGHLLVRLGQLDQAMDAYRKVLALGEAGNNRDFLAAAYGNLGNVYLTQNNLDEAEAMYRKVLRTLGDTASNRGHLASTYGNLGTIYLIRGDVDQAETKLREALKLHRVLGNKDGMARQYINLGTVYQTQGNLGRAEAKYRKALALSEDNKEGMANAYGLLGSMYLDRGDFDQAEAQCRKALDLHEAIGNKKGMAAVYGYLGNMHLTRGDLDQAEARCPFHKFAASYAAARL